MHEDVVEHAAKRVLRVFGRRRVLDGLAYGDAQGARGVGVFFEDVATRLRQVGGARVHRRAVGLHHDPAVGLLFVGDANHVDRAFKAHLAAGEGQGGAPLAGARLGGQAPYAFLFIVKGLGDGGVRLVAARGRATLILVVDVGGGVENLLQAASAQ